MNERMNKLIQDLRTIGEQHNKLGRIMGHNGKQYYSCYVCGLSASALADELESIMAGDETPAESEN